MHMICSSKKIFASLFLIASIYPINSYSEKWTFNSSTLERPSDDIDLNFFSEGKQPAGIYDVDILLNGVKIDHKSFEFKIDNDDLVPCLKLGLLNQYGIKVNEINPIISKDECVVFNKESKVKIEFQFYSKLLAISIAPEYIRPKLTGIAPPELWNNGVSAILLNYIVNGNRYKTENKTTDSVYAQLSPGMNIGAWRLRQQLNYQKSQGDSGKWQSLYVYAVRGLNDLKGQLTLGESVTSGDIFNSVPFSGIMLASDDAMVPFNQRSFSPMVQGIANSQARVDIKQNGYTIYSTTVPAGAFTLNDIPLSGATSGTLQVVITESDGSVQTYSVPYQTPAIAVRKGYFKYGAMGGEYRPSNNIKNKPWVGQFTGIYGVTNNNTLYGGIQVAERFFSVVMGTGYNLGGLGAFSIDLTTSNSKKQFLSNESGEQWRLRYTKAFESTGTALAFTHKHSTSAGYSTLNTALDNWDNKYSNYGRSSIKNYSDIYLRQSLKDWGYLNISGSITDYWNNRSSEKFINADYGITINKISYNIGVNRTYSQINGKNITDDRVNFNVSIPLNTLTGSEMNATLQASSLKNTSIYEVGLNGRNFDKQLYWNVKESYRNSNKNGSDNTHSLYLNWNGRYGQAAGNYNYSNKNQQMSIGFNGGAVIHKDGIALGQYMNDTVAMIAIPNVPDVSVTGRTGVKTGFNGYTLANNINPYQENEIGIDVTNLPNNVDITQTSQTIIPTKDSVIMTKFNARVGRKVLMQLINNSTNKYVPFGAIVYADGQDGYAWIVGYDGQVYLTGMPDSGKLTASWGGYSCNLNYQLPNNENNLNVTTMIENCK